VPEFSCGTTKFCVGLWGLVLDIEIRRDFLGAKKEFKNLIKGVQQSKYFWVWQTLFPSGKFSFALFCLNVFSVPVLF
jgi:hypothetical protein